MFYLAAPIVIIVTIVYSIVAALTRPIDPNARIYHSLMKSWSRTLLFLLRVKVTVSGEEHLRAGEQYIFIANHSSYLDIIAIGASLPEGGLFVYKEELTKVPIWGWSLRLSPFVMVRRSDARHAMRSIERAAEDIREKKQSVVIFPEGTRSNDGKLGAFKRGGFLLATKTGVPLVPLAIRGASSLLPRGEWRVKPGRIHLRIGNPVPGERDLNRNEERALQENMHTVLYDMLASDLTS